MREDWLGRWTEGRIGWHEVGGNTALKKYWPTLPAGSRVLVPLCGKSADLLWLAREGYDVTGVELSDLACAAFFTEQALAYELSEDADLLRYRALELPLSIYCGDYFEFGAEPFDAIFDRGSLVAFPSDVRPDYVRHTKSLLKPGAFQFLLTLEYDQSAAAGPPWAVPADEVQRFWPGLVKLGSRNDIENGPPKFRNAGLSEFLEVVWAG